MTNEAFLALPKPIRDGLLSARIDIAKISALHWAYDPIGLPFVQRLDLEPEAFLEKPK